MLDDDHGVARFDEAVQNLQQFLDVVKVQAGGWLIEDVKGLAGAPAAQLTGQFDALGLAAGQGRGGLPQLDVIQADVVKGLQHLPDLGNIAKVGQRLLHVHLQNVADILILEADLQGLAVKAASLAHRAGDPDIGEEIHLQAVGAVAFAGLTSAARLVEAEPPRLVAPNLGLRHQRVQAADFVENLDVGGRIGTGRPPDRRLVDVDDLVNIFHAFNSAIAVFDCRFAVGIFHFSTILFFVNLQSAICNLQSLLKDVVDERRFSGAGNAGNAHEFAQRDSDIDVFEVIVTGTEYFQPLFVSRPAYGWNGDAGDAPQILAGEAVFVGGHLVIGAGRHDMAAANSGTGAEIDQVIGGPHRLLVMLDHQDGITHVAQALEAGEQALVIARVQADAGLIENIQNPDQAAADLACQANTLRLAPGQGRGAAVQRQIVQADIE